jgi:hypothetical protein
MRYFNSILSIYFQFADKMPFYSYGPYSMYPDIDQNSKDIFAYSFKAADLVRKILSAATAFNNNRMDIQMWSSKIRDMGRNVTMKINACI